jgi:two-component system OmpR family response regulator/two-component system response regulator QseB
MRILLVEDDNLLGDGIQAGLGQAGFGVDWVRDGVAGELSLKTGEYAGVVLDLGLPRLSGLELLRRLRAVRIRTGKGLDAGADDYVVKPFDLSELAARLRALVRRSRGEAAPKLRVGQIELDPAARSVSYRGRPVDLQQREFALLHELMLNAGRVLSREQLSQRLYSWGEEIESNAIEVHVHHLRKKLAPELLRTVRGVGYMLARDAA